MVAIVSLMAVLLLALLITRIGSAALVLTGLSHESARFQARSAYTGVGFTTTESEAVVAHPVRRRIIMLLMLLGNVGVSTVIATLIVSLLNTTRSEHWVLDIVLMVAGAGLIWAAATSCWVERRLNRVITWGLRRWTRLEVHDYVALLQLQHGYAVSEMKVQAGDWLAGKNLRQAALSNEGVLVLGIQRTGGAYIGAPRGDSTIEAGDILVLYAPIHRLAELDQRRAGPPGEEAHHEAVLEHREELADDGDPSR